MIKKMGILQEFFKNKTENYIEPERKGTPKGDPIGFSLVKYKAALLLLTNYRVKKIAKLLNISEGLLRKWKTEYLFKNLRSSLFDDFVEFYLAKVEQKIGEAQKLYNNSYNQPFEKIMDREPKKIETGDFFETNFSPKLRESIISRVFNLAHSADDFRTKLFIKDNILPVVFKCQLIEMGCSPEDADRTMAEDREDTRKFLHDTGKDMIKVIRNVLLNPSATDHNRKEALIALRLLGKLLK